mgnify:CR=1 FL=1
MRNIKMPYSKSKALFQRRLGRFFNFGPKLWFLQAKIKTVEFLMFNFSDFQKFSER